MGDHWYKYSKTLLNACLSLNSALKNQINDHDVHIGDVVGITQEVHRKCEHEYQIICDVYYMGNCFYGNTSIEIKIRTETGK